MKKKIKKLRYSTGPVLLVTHNGSFHADDIFACATLILYLKKMKKKFSAQGGPASSWKIIRTRDEKEIKNGDYVFDIGNCYNPKLNRFDHHQKGGAGERKNGIQYSSFGLVWKKFGEKLAGSKKVAEIIEKKLVQPIDAYDNGVSLVRVEHEIVPYLVPHMFLDMCPTWKEGKPKSDKMFFKSVIMAKEILERVILHAQDTLKAEKIILKAYHKNKDKRIIFLEKKYPYEEILNRFPEPIYVIFERQDQNKFWEIEAVRNNFRSFVNRKNFPKAWAGLRDEELRKVSGVKDAIFCHRGLFMAIAKSKEGAVKLAQIALEK